MVLDFQIPANFTNSLVQNIFNNQTDPATGLVTILFIFLTGFVTLVLFFYFSKRFKMWKSMDWPEKITFAFVLGIMSIINVVTIFFSLFIINNSWMNSLLELLISGAIPILMLAGFLLYECLTFSSIFGKSGRPFLKLTLAYLFEFMIMFSLSLLVIVVSIKILNSYLIIALWIIAIILLYFFTFKKINESFKK